jgi:ketosteroid isomerase-like protein
MSQENVDNLRRGFEAYARGDLDEALANLNPDVVYKPIQEAAVRGRDAVRASLERWDAEWDEMEMTSEEIIDAGDHLIKRSSFAGAVGAAGSRSRAGSSRSTPSKTARRCAGRSFQIESRPSKPAACRSKTLTANPRNPWEW